MLHSRKSLIFPSKCIQRCCDWIFIFRGKLRESLPSPVNYSHNKPIYRVYSHLNVCSYWINALNSSSLLLDIWDQYVTTYIHIIHITLKYICCCFVSIFVYNFVINVIEININIQLSYNIFFIFNSILCSYAFTGKIVL